jgi:hypothetical protein
LLFALRHIGLLGWAGALLVLSSLVYAAIIAPEQRALLSAASVEIAGLQQRRAAMANAPGSLPEADGRANPAAELPSMKTTPDVLLKLDGIARKDRLQLTRNDYRYVDQAVPASGKKAAPAFVQDQFVEVRISMPASGRYDNIRAFIAHALENLPTLALEGLSLSRESIAQSDIQAQLRFTLFVRRGS